MGKRKKKRSRPKRSLFNFGVLRGKKRGKVKVRLPKLGNVVRVLGVLAVFVAVGVVFGVLSNYVKERARNCGRIELLDVPAWYNQVLAEKIRRAATAGGGELELNEEAAQTVQENLTKYVPWIYDVKARTTHEKILVKAKWRRPLAMVRVGDYRRFYIDGELVVLDYVPLVGVNVIEVKGLAEVRVPTVGEVWNMDDLSAAVTIIANFAMHDESVAKDKPLLAEIESIDVRNLDGRKRSDRPHIILYARDKAEIIWGARFGAWQRYMESTDEQKIAKLYSYYENHGTLLYTVKRINLCDPLDTVPLPIDNY